MQYKALLLSLLTVLPAIAIARPQDDTTDSSDSTDSGDDAGLGVGTDSSDDPAYSKALADASSIQAAANSNPTYKSLSAFIATQTEINPFSILDQQQEYAAQFATGNPSPSPAPFLSILPSDLRSYAQSLYQKAGQVVQSDLSSDISELTAAQSGLQDYTRTAGSDDTQTYGGDAAATTSGATGSEASMTGGAMTTGTATTTGMGSAATTSPSSGGGSAASGTSGGAAAQTSNPAAIGMVADLGAWCVAGFAGLAGLMGGLLML